MQKAPCAFLDRIDGDVDQPVWQGVPWSEYFGDIVHHPGSGGGNSKRDDAAAAPPLESNNQQSILHPAATRFKALYDEDYFYIAAVLHPAPGLPTVAHFTQRNLPIYQRDSDFEARPLLQILPVAL